MYSTKLPTMNFSQVGAPGRASGLVKFTVGDIMFFVKWTETLNNQWFAPHSSILIGYFFCEQKFFI